jgi:PHD/YefM family antitoxin component YafN of YafNO toxin-antitoxin module
MDFVERVPEAVVEENRQRLADYEAQEAHLVEGLERPRDDLRPLQRTRRPVVLTVNGKANAVLIDARTFERHVGANNIARLLAPAEEDARKGRTRSMRAFLGEFKRAHKVSR